MILNDRSLQPELHYNEEKPSIQIVSDTSKDPEIYRENISEKYAQTLANLVGNIEHLWCLDINYLIKLFRHISKDEACWLFQYAKHHQLPSVQTVALYIVSKYMIFPSIIDIFKKIKKKNRYINSFYIINDKTRRTIQSFENIFRHPVYKNATDKVKLHICEILAQGTDTLDLSNSPITNRFLRLIAPHCRHLKELNLSGCHRITDMGLVHFNQHIYLEKLNLAYLTSITATGLTSIAKHTHLKEITLTSCVNLTDESIQILKSSEKLTKLVIDGCWNITEDSLIDLIQLKHLSHVAAKNCPFIEENFINHIQKNCALRFLDIRNNGITNLGVIQALKYRCPDLDIII